MEDYWSPVHSTQPGKGTLINKDTPRAHRATPRHAAPRHAMSSTPRGHALASKSPIYDSKVQRKSNANDGIGAPITVPVTACAITSVTRAPGESCQYTILQLDLFPRWKRIIAAVGGV